MTGWMDTAIGMASPAIAATQAAITSISGGGITTGSASLKADVGLTTDVAPGGGALIDVEIVPPLNTIEVGGVPLATPVSSLIPQPFNTDTIGLPPMHKNKIDTINEIIKNAPSPPPVWSGDLERIPEDTKSGLHKFLEMLQPPSFAYEGPLGGAGPLGLFAPAPGSSEYEAFVKRKEEPAQNLNLDPKIQLAEKENKWTTNISKTLGDFSKGFYEGFHEEKGHGLWDLIPGLPNTSNLPLILIVGGGILLLILIIK